MNTSVSYQETLKKKEEEEEKKKKKKKKTNSVLWKKVFSWQSSVAAIFYFKWIYIRPYQTEQTTSESCLVDLMIE